MGVEDKREDPEKEEAGTDLDVSVAEPPKPDAAEEAAGEEADDPLKTSPKK